MSLKLDTTFLSDYVSDDELKSMQEHVDAAAAKVINRSGAGSDFLGWYSLPDDYDRDEFIRIKAAAKRIRANTDIFIVIGIGGSYLGACAAIEFQRLKLQPYREKYTEDIFAETACSSSMNDLLANVQRQTSYP